MVHMDLRNKRAKSKEFLVENVLGYAIAVTLC